MLLKARTFSIITLCLLAVGVAQAEWKKVPSETMAWLHAVYFLDDRHGWIVGSRGTLLSTKDGGSTWSFSEKVTQDTIRDVYFSDPNHGWLLCEGSPYGSGESVSYLMVTGDGGKTWQRKDAFKGRDRVVRMFFMNSRFGCAVGEGGSVWCAVENEESWRKYPLPVRFLMLDGRILNEKTLILVGGGGTALRTDDWGATWLVASTPASHKSKVNSLFFTDDKNGWAVGVGGTVLFSQNSGQSWSDQRAPTRSELTDIFFYRPSVGFAVGDNGTIIGTSNSGADWTIEPSGTKHRLESVAATKELAFAVGFGGTVLVKEISQGGKSEIQR